MKSYFFGLVLFLIPLSANSQDIAQNFGNRQIGIEFQTAAVFQHKEEVAHLAGANPKSIEIHTNASLDGSKPWHKNLKSAKPGFFAAYINMDNPEVLGHTVIAGAYMTTPIIKNKWQEFEFRLGTGVVYNTRPFDLETNRVNNLNSTHISGLIYLRFSLMSRITDQLTLSSGIGLTHYSNGAYKLPNLGANITGANLGLYYRINGKGNTNFSENNIFDPDVISKKWSVQISFGTGVKEILPINGTKYRIYNLMLNSKRRIGRSGAWLAGVDINKNTSLKDWLIYYSPESTFDNDYRIAAILGYELEIGRISAWGLLGVYGYSGVAPPLPYYQKIGLKYDILKSTGVYVLLKAHGGIADFIEYGIYQTL